MLCAIYRHAMSDKIVPKMKKNENATHIAQLRGGKLGQFGEKNTQKF